MTDAQVSDLATHRERGAAAREAGDHATALTHFLAAIAAQPGHVASICDAAASLRQMGRYDEGVALLTEALSAHPTSHGLLHGLGLILRHRGDHQAALDYFTAASSALPGHPWTRCDMAAELREMRRFDEATTILQGVLADIPAFHAALHGLGLIRRLQGDHAAALEHFRAAFMANPGHANTRCDIAAELRALNRLDEAEEVLVGAVKDHPTLLPALQGLGHIARQRGDRARAAGWFQRAADADPMHAGSLCDLGAELRDLQRYNEADAAFRRALQLQPNLHAAWHGLGLVARRRGDHGAALDNFQRALDASPASTGARCDIAAELRDLNRFPEAEATLQALLSDHPGHHGALHGLGLVARHRGDPTSAADWFRKASNAEPEHLPTRCDIAAELRDLRRLDEAEAVLRGVLEQDGAFHTALHGMGLICRVRGDHGRALEWFQRAAQSNPSHLGSLSDVAAELRELGRFEEAENVLRGILRDHPGNQSAMHGLGIMARQRGDHVEALEQFRAASEANPGNVGVKCDMAAELRALGRLDEAAELLETARSQAPQSFGVLHGLGLVERLRRNHEGALAYFKEALQRSPGHIPARCDIAIELRDLARLDEATEVLEGVLTDHPGNRLALQGLGAMARAGGDHEAAAAYFQRAAEAAPDDLGASFDLANELLALGRWSDAEALCKDIVSRHPHSARGWVALAMSRRASHPPGEIIALLSRATEAEPANVWPKLMLAAEYRHQWRLDDALAIYDAILDSHPDDSAARGGKGHTLRRMGRQGEALTWLKAAADGPSPTEWAPIELARELADHRQFVEARAALNVMLEESPGHLGALNALSHVERLSGNLDAAASALEAAIQRHPDHMPSRVELARVRSDQGRPADAVAIIAEAAERQPAAPEILEAQANLAKSSDDFTAAIPLYEAAAAAAPTHLGVRLELARCLILLGRTEEGLSVINTAILQLGPSPDAYFTKIDIQLQLGLRRKAARDMEAAAILFPAHWPLWQQRTHFLIQIGQFADAEARLSSHPEANAADRLQLGMLAGHLAAARWDFSGAYQLMHDALENFPREAGAQYAAAQAAVLSFDFKATEKHLTAYKELIRTSDQLRGQSLNISQTHVGQMLDDFRIDGEVIDRIRAAEAEPPERRIEDLAEIARDAPDATAAALALLLTLRRQGRFISLAKAKRRRRPSPIPKTIVQFWDQQTPPSDVLALNESWRELNPGFTYRRFDSQDARAYLQEKASADIVAAYDRGSEPAMKADIFRLAVLYFDGGYYADADDRCIAPLKTITPGGCDLVLFQEEFGTIGNNLMAAAPANEVIGHALKSGVAAVNRGDHDMIWLATGPGLITRSLAETLAIGPAMLPQSLDRVQILQRSELISTVAIHCSTAYKQTRRHWSRSVYSIRSARNNAAEALPSSTEAG